MIVDGKAGPGTAGGDTIAREIETGIHDKGIKALVVRVDSPGGSVLASERIRQALIEAKQKKIPVVVSMGSVAASGGYWVSTPADFIYAEPSTITGSIGVFGVFPSFQGTLRKLGIGADGVKTTPLSGEPDLFKGPSPEANQLIQNGVNSMYARFLGVVAARATRLRSRSTRSRRGACGTAGRRTSSGSSTASAAWPRRSARRPQLAKLGDERGVTYLEPRPSWKDQLIEALASQQTDDEDTTSEDAFAVLSRGPERQLASMLAEVRSILAGPSIQARCLECGGVAPAAIDTKDVSLLAQLEKWLS